MSVWRAEQDDDGRWCAVVDVDEALFRIECVDKGEAMRLSDHIAGNSDGCSLSGCECISGSQHGPSHKKWAYSGC